MGMNAKETKESVVRKISTLCSSETIVPNEYKAHRTVVLLRVLRVLRFFNNLFFQQIKTSQFEKINDCSCDQFLRFKKTSHDDFDCDCDCD